MGCSDSQPQVNQPIRHPIIKKQSKDQSIQTQKIVQMVNYSTSTQRVNIKNDSQLKQAGMQASQNKLVATTATQFQVSKEQLRLAEQKRLQNLVSVEIQAAQKTKNIGIQTIQNINIFEHIQTQTQNTTKFSNTAIQATKQIQSDNRQVQTNPGKRQEFKISAIVSIRQLQIKTQKQKQSIKKAIQQNQIQLNLQSKQNSSRNLSKIIKRTPRTINLKDLTVDHTLPQLFHIGQIFRVKGTLKVAASQQGFPVNLKFINTKTSSKVYTFKTKIQKNKKQFQIYIDTLQIQEGDYYLSFFSGYSGSYSTQPTYKVKMSESLKYPKEKALKACQPATNLQIDILNNKTRLYWIQKQKNTIKRITFFQQKSQVKRIQYTLTNFQNQFFIPFQDFQSFIQGQEVTVTICCALSQNFNLASQFSQSVTLKFKAGKHHFDSKTESFNLKQQIPWKVKKGQTIKLSGWCSEQIKNKFPVQQPNFKVGQYKLVESDIQRINPKTLFNKTFTFTDQGAYILEINDVYGSAALNRPIYVGDAFPIIPDYQDMQVKIDRQKVISEQPIKLDQQRKIMLNLVNEKRKQWGLKPLKLHQELNTLAQGHSIDMVQRNFFGHVNPDKQGPSDRAKRMKLTYSVGQNVALNQLLVNAHLSLCRSPGHLANIVNENYQNIGFGIAKDKQNSYFVTQNFSSRILKQNPLTQRQFSQLRSQIIQWVVKHSPYNIIEQKQISFNIQKWQNLSTTQTILKFIGKIQKYSFCGMSSASLDMSWRKNMTKDFKDSYLVASAGEYKRFGLGIKQLQSTIKFDVVYITT